MKYLFASIGTRGDIEPFIALAQLLQENGHQVKLACPEQYLYLLKDLGILNFGLDKRFIKLIQEEEGKQIMGGKVGFLKRLSLLISLYKKSLVINRNLMQQQAALVKEFEPDLFIFSSKALYGLIYHAQYPGKALWLSPIPCMVYPVQDYPNIGFRVNFGSFFNKLSYQLANAGIVKSISQSVKNLNMVSKPSSRQLKDALKTVPLIYSISLELYARRQDWPQHVQVLGYLERDKKQHFEPSIEIEVFLQKYPKVLFLTFGSMENPEPLKNTLLFLNVLRDLNIPTIVNCANGGLQKVSESGELFHFVNGIPYDWILPQVHAAIHHGGAGTTHLALKYACPTMIIPHIADQYHWNQIIHKKRFGPKGVALNKANYKVLNEKISDLWNNETYLRNARQMADKMSSEDVTARYLDFLNSV